MPLRDFLKKKDALAADTSNPVIPSLPNHAGIEFKFVRTTTENEEEIEIPSFPDDEKAEKTDKTLWGQVKDSRSGRPHLGFRKSSNAIYTNDPTAQQPSPDHGTGTEEPLSRLSLEKEKKREHRLSSKLHFGGGRSRASSANSSTNIPLNLPDAPEAVTAGDGDPNQLQDKEARWEKRATMLAMGNPLADFQQQQQQQHHDPEKDSQTQSAGRGRTTIGSAGDSIGGAGTRLRSHSPASISRESDISIQEAVRLHESGELTESTHMFAQLASPSGENNPLAQVLYGLALRHGWGIEPKPEQAVQYLSLAASNSAAVEEQALTASGMRKGGAAKGELVLAIFELANCFRQGWGVKKDPVAARMYYETAANLGDTDAMEEAAWCFTEGFGGGKDKFKAAQYLRLAEKKGSSQVGNSWIWKEKYNPK